MKYGLIGKTLVHSYSKEIHEALGKYEYNLFSLSPEEMPEFIKKRDFNGLNVTIPYKKDVMSLCDEISPLAEKIGAVNTLYWKTGTNSKDDDGGKILAGHNTDYEGFLYAASRAKISFKDKKVLILGTGGTSLMARHAILDRGASTVYIATRSKTGAQKTLDSKQKRGDDDNISYITYDGLPSIYDDIEIIVNTTPVGTYPDNMKKIISLKDFKKCRAVMDVIYNPFKTALLLEAEKLGLKFSNGLPMLVAQATAAAGYFLGKPGSFEKENEKIISSMEREMKNIILIGMPGCGKSTVGKLLSKETGRAFIDMDEEIEKTAGISIPEIFEKEGEKGFRKRETEAAEKLGKERGLIIATGGGAVLKQENVDALRQNGVIIHIERPRYALATKGRPLSKDPAALKKMEKVRLPIYRACADITFDNSRSQSKTKILNSIMEVLKDEKQRF